MTKTIVARLDVDIADRLVRLAKMTVRTKSYYIKEAVKEKLDEMELVYLAKSRAENVRAGKSKTISWEEVKEQNGLQD